MTREEKLRQWTKRSTIEEILPVLRRDNFVIIDNHTGKDLQIEAAMIMEDGEIVQFLKQNRDNYQTLNRLYYDEIDDKVHVSTCAVVDLVYGSTIRKYNETENKRIFGSVNRIMKVFYKDGRVEQVA